MADFLQFFAETFRYLFLKKKDYETNEK